MFEANVDEVSLFVRILSKIGMFFSGITVNRMLELGIGFIHNTVPMVGLNDIYDLMALFIIYVMVDRVMSLNIGDHCVRNDVLGELHSNMRPSCLYRI